MSVETQLRALAETFSAEQRPVSAEEAISRADRRELLDDPPRRREWMLVAASVALLVGLLAGLLAWVRTPGDDPLPIVSIPEKTVAPDTTVPATAVTPTTAPEIATPPVEALVNEPTLDYRDGVEWWVPRELPDGWRYGYAVDDGLVQTIHLLADDRSTIDVEFGADGATIGEVAVDAATEDLGGELWEVALNDGVGVAARAVDGRLLSVRGPIESVRSVAAELQLVLETDLVRPPFRDDAEPGPVVVTLPADEVGGDEPFELRAHTDGLFTTVGGEIKQVSPVDPLAFGEPVYELTGDAESYPVVLTGVALDRVAQITFGLQEGGRDIIDVTPTDSDGFAESFYAFVIEVPASILELYDQGGLERLTRWTFTYVDGEQRVYDEPGSQSCVNCDALPDGPGDLDNIGGPPATASGDASTLEFEPTNIHGDELWLIPAQVPEGFEFDHAQRSASDVDAFAQTIVYRAADPELAADIRVTTYLRADGGVVTTARVDSAKPVEIDGQTWSLEESPPVGEGAPHGFLSGVVDGRLVEVSGDRSTAVAVAGMLELVPESQLPRPPFDPSTSVIVARLPHATLTADIPIELTELRAATDGASISLNEGTPTPVTFDQPVGFNGMMCLPVAPGAGTGVCHVSGYTVPDVARLEFEQLDGDVVTAVPEDLSGKFGIGFFLVAIEVPADAMAYASVVPAVIARDTDGRVLAAISEPF